MAAALVEMGARRSPRLGRRDRRRRPGAVAPPPDRAARAGRLPRHTPRRSRRSPAIDDAPGSDRDEAIASALAGAADVALAIARAGTDTAFLAELVADRGEPSGRDDAQAAVVLAEAGTRVAAALVAANLVTAEGDDRETAAASCARSAAMVRSRMGE